MHRNGYLGASVKNLTLPFTSATSISYKMGIFPLSDDVCGIYLIFLCINFIDLVTSTF